jgi:hypothetical protein
MDVRFVLEEVSQIVVVILFASTLLRLELLLMSLTILETSARLIVALRDVVASSLDLLLWSEGLRLLTDWLEALLLCSWLLIQFDWLVLLSTRLLIDRLMRLLIESLRLLLWLL